VTDPRSRLRHLDDERFGAFVGDLADAVWGGRWRVSVSPPSPGGGVDVHLVREDDRMLANVRQYSAGEPVPAPAVRDLVAMRGGDGPSAVLLATTSGFSEAAQIDAAAAGVELIDGDGLCRLARTAGVPVPEPSGSPDFERALAAATAHWPPPLRRRAREVVEDLDDLAPFDREVIRGEVRAIRFRADGVSATARFGAEGLVVAVDGEAVARLTAGTDRAAAGARRAVRDAVREASGG